MTSALSDRCIFFSHNKSFRAYANSTLIVESLLKDYDKRIRPGVKGKSLCSDACQHSFCVVILK